MRRYRHARNCCARGREWISLELDGELPEFERVLLAAHLAHCAQCSSFADVLSALVHEIRQQPPARPSRLLAPPRRRRVHVAAAPVAVAAAAAVASIVLGLASAFGSHGPATRTAGSAMVIPPVQSSLLVALRDEGSHSARHLQDAVQRRPLTRWWVNVRGGAPVET